MRNIKVKSTILTQFILMITFFFLLFFTAESKFFIVKDKEGNIICFTSQNKISSQDKAAGCTLIEKYGQEKKDPCDFKEINWKEMHIKAREIEEIIHGEKDIELPYSEFVVIATAYTPHKRSCYPYADGYTSTNCKAGYGSIAIDPEYGMFSYGDVLYVEGYGVGFANDCGSAIKGKRIDVCYDLGDEKKAMDWGRRQVRVWILKKGKG